MHEAVIIDAIRTPFGKRGGAYSTLRPDALLASTLERLVERSGVAPARIGDVIAGCVSQAGEQSANIGRQAALLAGLPPQVPAVTLNRMCGSGQTAVHMAAQAVAAGDIDYAIGCGVESMSRVPMFLDVTLGAAFKDWGVLNPALLERHELLHQGESAELIASHWGISRQALDDFAAESHRKAHAAAALPRREMVAVTALQADEGVRATLDRRKMAQLAPLFRAEGGVITAGNASQMTDGAAALLVGNAAVAKADGLRARARFRSRVALGSDPRMQLDGVIPATTAALAKAGVQMADIDWVEVNEAFACVPIAWSRALGVDLDRINPWGGAIAHGHPLGATGVGLTAKALTGLEATGGTLGLVVFCVGHGMATATVIERC